MEASSGGDGTATFQVTHGQVAGGNGAMALVPLASVTGRGGGSGGRGGRERREDDALEVNLHAARYLMDFARVNSLIRRVDGMFAGDAFGDHPFTIVVGDPGVEIAYLNTTHFKDAVARILVEARNYERLFGLCVVRLPRDRPRHFVRLFVDGGGGGGAADAGDDGEFPVRVEPLGEQADARLVFHRRTGQWEYTPGDPDDARLYEYRVYVNPHRPFPGPISLRRYLSALDPALGSVIVGACEDDTGRARRRGGGRDTHLLPSPYWEAVQQARLIHEATANRMDAEHLATHPRAIYIARPMREVAPELLSTDTLLRTQSVQQASAEEQQTLAEVNWQRGRLWQKRFNTEPMPGAGTTAGGEDETKRYMLRAAYGRPDMNDSAVHPPETIAQVTQEAAVWHLDPDALHLGFAQLIARLMGGLPVSDILAVYAGTASTASVGVEAGGALRGAANRGQSDAMQAHRQAVFRQERHAYNTLFAWLYSVALADIDMLALSNTADRFTALQRTTLAESLGRRHFTHATTKQERRRLLYRALAGGQRGRKRRAAGGEPAASTAEGEAEAAPTAGELRDLIVSRLASGEMPAATLIFDADVEAEMRNEKRRDHEWLDAETHKARIAEVDLLARAAAAGVLDPQCVADAAKELLDLDCATAPTEIFEAAMGILEPPPGEGGPPPKKRARKGAS